MFIKICGTTNLADAELAVDLGADALGFIFAPSKRQVSIEQAAAITRCLPLAVEKVGVFVEPNASVIVKSVENANLTAIQLHFPYDLNFLNQLEGAFGRRVSLWQVVPVEVHPADREIAERDLLRTLRETLSDGRLSAVLLDTAKLGLSGGLGESFPWARTRSVFREAAGDALPNNQVVASHLPKLILAGGLHAENVHEAVSALSPWGVDVVSGVEASPGRKDPARLASFMTAARAALRVQAPHGTLR